MSTADVKRNTDVNDERDEQYESAEDNIEIDGDELDAIIAEAIEAKAMDQGTNENP